MDIHRWRKCVIKLGQLIRTVLLYILVNFHICVQLNI